MLESLQTLLDPANPPALGPGPRPGTLTMEQLRERLDTALAGSRSSGARAGLLRALVLLWHDHFEAAHGIAQSVEDADGSYVHAILHRREPDYSNAKYWFHRVGRHDCYAELARRVAPLLQSPANTALARKILPRGEWDAFAFVDACEEASSAAAGDPRLRLLRDIQRIEFEVLAEHLAGTG
jgi:hypothetical protein